MIITFLIRSRPQQASLCFHANTQQDEYSKTNIGKTSCCHLLPTDKSFPPAPLAKLRRYRQLRHGIETKKPVRNVKFTYCTTVQTCINELRNLINCDQLLNCTTSKSKTKQTNRFSK
jgi:hypothetical protein